MKKVLIPFDGVNFSEGAMEFAQQMNRMEKIFLTGVFLPQVDYANLWSYAPISADVAGIPLIEERDTAVIEQNITRFITWCRINNIAHKVHKDFLDFALPELKKETRFSDLLILGSERFYESLGTDEPNMGLHEALHTAECPVVVVPEKSEFPKHNILAYDGTESSVFAIKQFAYLFPALCKNPTVLVTAGTSDNRIPSGKNIEELVTHHFPDVHYLALDIDPKKYFAVWASEKKASIVVSGSFHRSAFSEAFRKSFVSDIIRDHHLPAFIAHK